MCLKRSIKKGKKKNEEFIKFLRSITKHGLATEEYEENIKEKEH